ncbi:hypothetical protein LEMLEM_LOCUS1754 [Lemmus lemmus]
MCYQIKNSLSVPVKGSLSTCGELLTRRNNCHQTRILPQITLYWSLLVEGRAGGEGPRGLNCSCLYREFGHMSRSDTTASGLARDTKAYLRSLLYAPTQKDCPGPPIMLSAPLSKEPRAGKQH